LKTPILVILFALNTQKNMKFIENWLTLSFFRENINPLAFIKKEQILRLTPWQNKKNCYNVFIITKKRKNQNGNK
jgi:hypothetical protein